jgi:lipopolysaccharide transport system permease protein
VRSSQVTVITPRRSWLDWQLGQLWRYRDLVSLFVWRDFVSIYKQTVLGPVWHILRPLLTTVVFTVIFGGLAKLSTDGTSPFLFYMSGTIVWTYFANCLDNITKSFVANSNLLGKVYFPRLAIPLSLVVSNLVSFAIQFGIFLVVLIWMALRGAPVHLTAWVLTLPLVVVMLAGYGLGLGAILSAMTTRYRDFAYLVTFGLQLLMYLTPVIYPISSVPASYRWVVALNPLTPVIEAFRLAFLGAGTVNVGQFAASVVTMVIVLVFGLGLFSRAEQTVIDTI